MTATRRSWLVAALVVAVLLLVGSVVAVTAWAGSGAWADDGVDAPAGIYRTWVDRNEEPGMMGSSQRWMWEHMREDCAPVPTGQGAS